MDIPREQRKGRRLARRILFTMVVIVAIIAVTMGLARLEPAAPGVERETLLIDKVKQGNMVLEVRGVGRLMSEDRLVVPALVSGRVSKILVEPGALVEPNTVILELANPELELQWLDAQSQLNSAEARLRAEETRLQDQLLQIKADQARMEANLREAQLMAEVDQKQYNDHLISELDYKLSQARVENQKNILDINKQRWAMFRDVTFPAQLAEAQADLDQAQSRYNLKKNEIESLYVRAGAIGVLAPIETQIEPGQQVTEGQVLARITNPQKLKARLQIPQGQARDVMIGLPTEIDTYNGVVSGRVSRIEPTVMAGNVTVDISLEGPLPKGARPDLSVVGTIQIDKLNNILYVGRPVFASSESTVELFKLVDDGRFAIRTKVQFGRSSVSTIEVIEGLALDDEIILSDMSQWDEHEKIKLK